MIVGHRQTRPSLEGTGAGNGCPFCVGGLEAPQDYDVAWFPNRWPALPGGVCEVVLYTPEHEATFWSLGIGGATKVIELWASRCQALAALDHVKYVQVFENRGPEAGATVSHPHGQIYGFDTVPPVVLTELTNGNAERDLCPLCSPTDDALVVSVAGGWRAWVPEAAGYPFELRIAPVDHIPDLPSVGDVGVRDAAAVLVDSLARLDQLFGVPMPYMLWWHQRPCDGGTWPRAHVHAHVAALLRSPGVQRYVAGVELGTGILFNPIVPEDAAARLRTQAGARA